ncbi:MAG: RNA polymerase sigma factor [Aminipila sp.]
MHEKNSELVLRLKKGDESAFEEIFEKYKVKAVRTAYLITGNRELAEDIVQETFIESFRTIQNLKEPRYFETWFFKILTHIAWKYSKKEKRLVPVENIFESEKIMSQQQEDYNFINEEKSLQLSESLDKLEVKQKTAIYLYYYGGFSISEIAKIMGCFEGTVKSRLYTARKNLKKSLQRGSNYKKEDMKDAIAYKF